ncbi:MAG: sulfur carrier protein ThiS adenylyltransferase ThiF [Coriobacteriaceae bacterium]|nr:sulfur carrier protein ThiS adenylyltransferase ThiF [Coriobacteriaceae bacterium]
MDENAAPIQDEAAASREFPISKQELDRAFDARFPASVAHALRNAHVAIAGLGGLGSNIAVMLARSGVGHLLLVDFDTVDTTNLNRQAYGISHLGMPKTQAIRQILADINPYLDIQTKQVRVTERNAAELFSGWPILCEAFDKPDQKSMLISTVLAQCPATTMVSGNGMAGYGEANGIRTERRLGRLYVCGDQSTDVGNSIGLMAPRVAVCAGHQANKVIQLILQQAGI